MNLGARWASNVHLENNIIYNIRGFTRKTINNIAKRPISRISLLSGLLQIASREKGPAGEGQKVREGGGGGCFLAKSGAEFNTEDTRMMII